MPDQETLRGQQNLLTTLRKRLRVQIDQQHKLGAFAPPYIQIEIDDAQTQIKKIKAYLRQNGVPTEDVPEDGEVEAGSSQQPQDLPSQVSKTSEGTDFVIITALEEERDAMLSKLPKPRKIAPLNEDIYVYYSSQLPVTFSDDTSGTYTIITTTLLGMGRVQAANATSAAIYRWKPRYLLLVGIAGGIEEANVKVGDIIISNQIVDYELQKQMAANAQIRWEVHRAAPRLLAAVSDFPYMLWQDEIAEARPGPGIPTRHIGPIASGDKVVAFQDTLTHYRDMWPKLIGVEMEAGGAATGTFQSANPPGFFMIRGVSDLADAKKGTRSVEKWRRYACDVAAAYTIALLKSGPVPIKHG